MNRPTRRSVLAGVAAALPTAGCLSDSEGTTRTRRTTDAATTERTTGGTTATTREATATAEETTTELDFWTRASKEPNPDHWVAVVNEASEERSVRVRVVREETGETVFDEMREISAGEEVRPYNLRRADPDGIESFRVCAESGVSDSSRACVTLKTNECYGNAYVTVAEDGSLGATYSIC